jgi:hypothetical protein
MASAVRIALVAGTTFAFTTPSLGQIVTEPFNAYYELRIVGHPPLPNDLGGLAIRPTDPGRLLITSLAQSAEAAVWSVGVIRDADGHIVALDDEPPRFEFSGGGAAGGIYGSLVVMPNGTILFPTAETNQIGEVLPGQAGPGLLIPVLPYGVGGYPSALLVNPSGWCGAGNMLVFSADVDVSGQHASSVELIPSENGYWLIDNDLPSDPYPTTVTGAAAIPDNCATAELGRLVVTCENYKGQVTVVTPNESSSAGGMVQFGTREVMVEGILGPRGVTVDPITNDLILVDRDPALPPFADRIIAIRFLGGCACAADIDRNGRVAGSDLAILLAAWGSECIGAGADINGDGVVDAMDLAEVLAHWGPCPG